MDFLFTSLSYSAFSLAFQKNKVIHPVPRHLCSSIHFQKPTSLEIPKFLPVLRTFFPDRGPLLLPPQNGCPEVVFHWPLEAPTGLFFPQKEVFWGARSV